MAHDFQLPVTAYLHHGSDAVRLNLPSGCMVNERGFVYP